MSLDEFMRFSSLTLRTSETPFQCFQFLRDEPNGTWCHLIVVGKAVAACRRLQIAYERNAERAKFHPQTVRAIPPAVVERVTTEKLVSRPIERMNIENRGHLSGCLCVGV